MKPSLLLSSILLATVTGAWASDSAVSLVPKKLYVFEEGMSFIELRGQTTESASMKLENIPPAIQGTFWVDVAKPAQILKVTGKNEKVSTTKGISILDVYRANAGSQVSLTLGNGRTIDGCLLHLHEVVDSRTPVIFVKTDKGIVSVGAESIVDIEFVGLQELKPGRKVKDVRTIVLDLTQSAPGCEIVATSLTTGMAWSPSYKMDLSDAGEAVLTGQATVVNNMAPLEHVQLELVSGTPSVATKNRSPLFDTQEDAESVDRDNSGRALLACAALPADGLGKSARPNFTEIIAQGLHFYPQGDFTSNKGEAVLLPLFEDRLSYDHIYTLDIPARENRGRGYQEPSNTQDEVWHCIRLKNTLGKALAAGTVEFVSAGRITGQGRLNFTSENEMATIRQNKASEILTRRSEKIVSSNDLPDGKKKIAVDGTLIVRNCGRNAVKMEIAKHLIGLPTQASDGGELQSSPQWNTWSSNPSGLVKWTIQIAPNKEQKLTYSYEYIE